MLSFSFFLSCRPKQGKKTTTKCSSTLNNNSSKLMECFQCNKCGTPTIKM